MSRQELAKTVGSTVLSWIGNGLSLLGGVVLAVLIQAIVSGV